MKKQYEFEREGQIAFYENYQIPYEGDNSVLIDNTDGVYNGCLLEFKLHISNLNKVLFQAIKYLSKMRIKGESVPATIILVSLNDTMAYIYHSQDYFNDIHEVYIGSASRDNDKFSGDNPKCKLDWDNQEDSAKMRHLLKDEKTIQQMYMPVQLDEDCIVGWAMRYYRENHKAIKGDFIGDEKGTKVQIKGEIREPKHFAGHILPYEGETNEKFKYLMDCLNDRLSKKDLGAFYTPIPYCKKATELVQMAVNRVPNGNDYIILDRCAGTGNLEAALIGLYDKNGSELITHCVVSTYEYYEYKVLIERFADIQLREIIPPTEKDVDYSQGRVKNADAMSKEYLDNTIIKKYVDNPKCTIILFENPPYRDQSQKNNKEETKNKKHTDKSFIRECMSSEKKYGLAVNDILNCFVYSAWKYYMRNEHDSYIIFAPIKHWKRVELSNKQFRKGFIFNRKHFHATQEAISCLCFYNKESNDEELSLEAYNINTDNETVFETNITVKKSHNVMSELFDKRKMQEDNYERAICCNRDGTEAIGRECRFKPYYNDNIIGYLRAESYGFDANSVCLVRNGLYNGNGFYLRKDKYLSGLPLFVAKQFPFDDWYLKNMIDTTSDGGDKYTHDKEFLKSCLIYTCLSNQNKCLSFAGSDGRHYDNELCFDDDTLASKDLKNMKLDEDEKYLIDLWDKILTQAKTTKNYNHNFKYGVYQIMRELNTFTTEDKLKIYDYPELNGNLVTLRNKLKDYYKSHITDKVFKYELLK